MKAAIVLLVAWLGQDEIEYRIQQLSGDGWRSALEDLLRADRVLALQGLERTLAQASGLLAFRTSQVFQVLRPASSKGLRYGIFIPDPVAGLDQPIAGLEIWINESGKGLQVQDCIGVTQSRGTVVDDAWVCNLNWRDAPTMPLAAAEVRIKERADFRENTALGGPSWLHVKRQGTAIVSATYTSAFLVKNEEAWKGKIESNGVRIAFR